MELSQSHSRRIGGIAADRRWRIAVVEDHLLQRNATVQLFDSQPDLRVVCSVETIEPLIVWLRRQERSTAPHLVVLDLMVDRGPSVSPDKVRMLRSAGVNVLILSAMASPPLVREMIRAGAAGVVGKQDSEDDILTAVRSVLQHRSWMTRELAHVIAGDATRPRLGVQEERALVLYASGLKLGEVAAAIGVQPNTAKKYLDRVKEKYAEAGRPLHTKLDMARVVEADGYTDHGVSPESLQNRS